MNTESAVINIKPIIPEIDVQSDEFGNILVSAVRYALGRCTYIPKLTCDFITPLIPYISSRTILNIRESIITWDESEYSFGSAEDVKMWNDFYENLTAEFEKRNSITINTYKKYDIYGR